MIYLFCLNFFFIGKLHNQLVSIFVFLNKILKNIRLAYKLTFNDDTLRPFLGHFYCFLTFLTIIRFI